MCGLTSIRSVRLNLVIGTDRDVERLFLISIEVTDKKTVAAVRILKPALIRSRDALSGIVCGFEGELLG